MTPTGIDGHELDCIIYGTGFKATDFMFPMEIDGPSQSLREAWADGPHAHLGITVPGFPSLYLMYGPNTNTSGGSIIFYLEAQAAYIRQALQLGAVEVRPDVEAMSDRATQARVRRHGVDAMRLLVPRRLRTNHHQLAALHARVRPRDRAPRRRRVQND